MVASWRWVCCAAIASVWACASRASPASLRSAPLSIRPRISLTMVLSPWAAVCALAPPPAASSATARASACARRRVRGSRVMGVARGWMAEGFIGVFCMMCWEWGARGIVMAGAP
jgi:hypothetical protein